MRMTKQLFPEATRYLSTTEHKTGNSFLARVPVSEEAGVWNMLLTYKKKLRPVPADKQSEKYLFLNSKGRHIKTASGDFLDVLRQENLPEITSTRVRHALETYTHNVKSTEEQACVSSLLSHSQKVAKQVYVDDRKREFFQGL